MCRQASRTGASAELKATIARQEKQEAHTGEAGFLLRVFPRERRYAELGYLFAAAQD